MLVARRLDTKHVLFIMAGKNVHADALGDYLWKTKEFGFKESEVLVIHTDEAGEITKRDLEKAREVARDIDKAESRIKAIGSGMMLREGGGSRRGAPGGAVPSQAATRVRNHGNGGAPRRDQRRRASPGAGPPRL